MRRPALPLGLVRRALPLAAALAAAPPLTAGARSAPVASPQAPQATGAVPLAFPVSLVSLSADAADPSPAVDGGTAASPPLAAAAGTQTSPATAPQAPPAASPPPQALFAADGDGPALPRYVGAFYFSLVTSVSGPDVVVPAYDGDVYASDLASSPGFAFGLWLEKPFGDRLAGRVVLEYASLGGRTLDYWLYSKKYSTHQLALLCDVQLYLGKSRQFYVFGGFGYYDRFIDESLWDTQTRSYGVVSGACRSLGAGAFVSRRVGVEFRRVNGDAPWSQVSLVFRS